MNSFLQSIAIASVSLAFAGSAPGAEDSVAGKWKGQFDSQIGLQKYTFEFKVDGETLSGTAIGEREMGTNEVKIVEGKITKDQISFVEPLKFDENDLRIEYTGKVSGDEIKLHRKVGDFAEEDFVAKRVKEPEAKPEAKPEAGPEKKPAPSKP
jgi:hypothetical protein